MREDFIQFLWKYKLLLSADLKTTTGVVIRIKSLGQHNHYSGPDFFNSRIVIGEQEWAGNVEMHINSSDWFLHGHDHDAAYDNVILHVVWNHDIEIKDMSGNSIPVLEVRDLVPDHLMDGYERLFQHKEGQFINCENLINLFDKFKIAMWLEKIFIERLEAKSTRIADYLKRNNNDWEAAFFQTLIRSFGSKVNAMAFETIAQSIPQQILRKLARDAFQLEAVLLGQAGILDKSHHDRYFKLCHDEYAFAKAKFQLTPAPISIKLFRLRPSNYPTIRLSQIAQLYHRHPMLFGEVLLAKTKQEFYQIFKVTASAYWNDHHLFDKPVESREKQMTDEFMDLIILNCVVPFKFYHAQQMGKDITEELFDLMTEIKPEKNKVVSGFQKLIKIESALHSQSVLQLKSQYCDINKCLSCDIGVGLLRT